MERRKTGLQIKVSGRKLMITWLENRDWKLREMQFSTLYFLFPIPYLEYPLKCLMQTSPWHPPLCVET